MKYTIMHVNDRAKQNMDHNKVILKNLEYVDDISFFNGNEGNAWDILNHINIKTKDVWNPYDGRSSEPLPGEYGVWLSTLNIFQYIVDNSIDVLLVLEDDITLAKDATEKLKLFMSELPEGWDFLSLYHFVGHNQFDESTDIGLKKIHKSINQPSAAQAMVYSNSGAKKLLKLMNRKGMEYTSDCFIFEQSRVGAVNGYSIRPEQNNFLVHEYLNIPSLIDPTNTRMVEM